MYCRRYIFHPCVFFNAPALPAVRGRWQREEHSVYGIRQSSNSDTVVTGRGGNSENEWGNRPLAPL